MISAPRRRKGSARCWILLGGPTLQGRIRMDCAITEQSTYPNVLRERNSSGARLSCSHLVITGPPSRDVPPAKLSPWISEVSLWFLGRASPQLRPKLTPAESRRSRPLTDRRLSRKMESCLPIDPAGESVLRCGMSNVPADQVRMGGLGIRGFCLMSGRPGMPCPRAEVELSRGGPGARSTGGNPPPSRALLFA